MAIFSSVRQLMDMSFGISASPKDASKPLHEGLTVGGEFKAR
jgi:hypothetical protein